MFCYKTEPSDVIQPDMQGLLDFFRGKKAKEETAESRGERIWFINQEISKLSDESVNAIIGTDVSGSIPSKQSILDFASIRVGLQKLLDQKEVAVILKYKGVSAEDMRQYEDGVFDEYEKLTGKNAIGDEPEFVEILKKTKLYKLEEIANVSIKTIQSNLLYKKAVSLIADKGSKGTFKDHGFSSKSDIVHIANICASMYDAINAGNWVFTEAFSDDGDSDIWRAHDNILNNDSYNIDSDSIPNFCKLFGIGMKMGELFEKYTDYLRHISSRIVSVVQKTQPDLLR